MKLSSLCYCSVDSITFLTSLSNCRCDFKWSSSFKENMSDWQCTFQTFNWSELGTLEFRLRISYFKVSSSELKTLECDTFNPDLLINLEQEENKHYLISLLRKRVDQALIPISSIQKFPAQGWRKSLFITNRICKKLYMENCLKLRV